jgi:hypothetical protein
MKTTIKEECRGYHTWPQYRRPRTAASAIHHKLRMLSFKGNGPETTPHVSDNTVTVGGKEFPKVDSTPTPVYPILTLLPGYMVEAWISHPLTLPLRHLAAVLRHQRLRWLDECVSQPSLIISQP